MFKRGELNSVVAAIAIVAIIGIVAMLLFADGAGVTGELSWSSGGKAKNTPCARECTMMCIDGASLPDSNVEELSVDDCVTQCLQARCNENVRGGQCDANVADGCCNVFAAPGQDPDCAPPGYCDFLSPFDCVDTGATPPQYTYCINAGNTEEYCCSYVGGVWCTG